MSRWLICPSKDISTIVRICKGQDGRQIRAPERWVFEKLLTNLLENAAKYSDAGSHISIRAHRFDDAIEIRVSDEGCGLPPGDADAIFRKFYRGKHPNEVPGIGLGLSICRAIVALHGGSITAHRRPRIGTEFVIKLPVVPGAPAAPADCEVADASQD